MAIFYNKQWACIILYIQTHKHIILLYKHIIYSSRFKIEINKCVLCSENNEKLLPHQMDQIMFSVTEEMFHQHVWTSTIYKIFDKYSINGVK